MNRTRRDARGAWRTGRPGRSRQGSVFVLVMSILAVLALLALMTTYSTRMELMAARNWANGVQARMAVVTGVPLYQAQPLPDGGARVQPIAGDQSDWVRPLSAPSRPLAVQPALPLEVLPSATPVPTPTPTRVDVLRTAAAAAADAAEREATPATVADVVAIEDESAKFNVNAILPWPAQPQSRPGADQASPPAAAMITEDVLARFIQSALDAHGIRGVHAAALAHAIAQHRLGPDGNLSPVAMADTAPVSPSNHAGLRVASDWPSQRPSARDAAPAGGAAADAAGAVRSVDPWLYWADPRRIPQGDDRPIASVDELLHVPGMTPAAFRVLAPYLTVFSVDMAAFVLPERSTASDAPPQGWPQIDPNTADAPSIVATLERRFPDADPDLLRQYAVNLIDWRDADRVPTRLRLGERDYVGFERNPCINEVCSDSSSFGDAGGGDDGQFIELYNPYREPIDLAGWRLVCGSVALPLRGVLAAEGFLVVVRDFNNEDDEQPNDEPEQGSFYNIYGVVPTGPRHRIEAYRQLNLPLVSGTVSLINPDGQVVDEFEYQGGQWTGAPMTFQRVDPRLRAAVRRMATPLRLNPGQDEPQLQRSLRLMEERADRPLRTALDAMAVPTAYAPPPPAGSQPQPQIEGAAPLPQLAAGTPHQLDVRVVDCFRIGVERAEVTAATPTPTPRGRAAPGTAAESSLAYAIALQSGGGKSFGRINLNTAPPAVIAALPGMDRALLERFHAARRPELAAAAARAGGRPPQLEPTSQAWWQGSSPLAPPRWRNLSDLIADEAVWGQQPLDQRLEAVAPFAELVCFHSMARRIVTANRFDGGLGLAEEGQDEARPGSQVFGERIVTADRGAFETVLFRFLGPGPASLGDPDVRYAAPQAPGVEPVSALERLAAMPGGGKHPTPTPARR